MDVLSSPTGAIAEAQRLASEAVGADRTWFLVNGSTVGLHAALLAHASPGATVAISRDCHQSVHAALVLSGARPLWVAPEHDTRFDVAWPSARRFEAAIAPAEGRPNPHLAAALVTSPNYFGVCANVSRIAAACTRAGSASPLPLIVDEAHGAHLPFLREGTDPPDALRAGAAVAVQSTHKTLGAMTQAAMVHARADRGARCDAIDAALAVLQTSSPSYILMASLDAARAHAATAARTFPPPPPPPHTRHVPSPSPPAGTFDAACALAAELKARLGALDGLAVLGEGFAVPHSACNISACDGQGPLSFAMDPLRLTLGVSEIGMTGFEVAQRLERDHGVVTELATHKCVVFVITLGTTHPHVTRLVRALETICVEAGRSRGMRERRAPDVPACTWAGNGEAAMTPREAFFARQGPVPAGEARGRVCARAVTPYPPGIPLLVPGELVTAEALEAIDAIRRAGGKVIGAEDNAIVCVWERGRQA